MGSKKTEIYLKARNLKGFYKSGISSDIKCFELIRAIERGCCFTFQIYCYCFQFSDVVLCRDLCNALKIEQV